jgi:hypothetical protein
MLQDSALASKSRSKKHLLTVIGDPEQKIDATLTPSHPCGMLNVIEGPWPAPP